MMSCEMNIPVFCACIVVNDDGHSSSISGKVLYREKEKQI
jgi:hypothetical protein